MGGRMGSNRIARLIVCLSAFLLASLWQSSAWAIDLPPPLEDVKEKIKEKIEEIKDKLPPPPDPDIEQQFRESDSQIEQIQQQLEGIGGSAEGGRRSQDTQSRQSNPRSQSQQAEIENGDLEEVVGGGHAIGGTGNGGLSFFCTRGEAMCFAQPLPQVVVEQPRAGGGLEFTGLDLQRAIAVFLIFAGAGTILLAWDARSRAALIDSKGSAAI